MTILVFNLLTVQQQTLRQVCGWILQYHQGDFPKLPNYQNFVAHCHRVLRGVAHTGHNWQGEHYGFKLHASIDNEGKLCANTGVSFESYYGHEGGRCIPEEVTVEKTTYNALLSCRRMDSKGIPPMTGSVINHRHGLPPVPSNCYR